LADGGHPGEGGAASGGQQRPQCLPLTAAAREGRAVLAEHLASGPDRVQRVALGPTATGWPLGSADLHDPLAVLLQYHRQAGAEAARSLHRPQAAARNLTVGNDEQLLVAGRVGAGGGLGQHPAEVGDGGRGQDVAVGVDADDAVDQLCQHGHAVVLLGWGRPWSVSAWVQVTARQDGDGTHPTGLGWSGCCSAAYEAEVNSPFWRWWACGVAPSTW
jgi:hypothetical protein